MFDASILKGLVGDSTLAMYSRDFNAYVAFCNSFDNALKPTYFARFRSHMSSSTTKSPSTINRMMSSIRSVFHEAATTGLISKALYAEFQFIKGVKHRALKHRKRTNARTVITPGQMREICDSPDSSTIIGIRDRALMLTMATSGCRISEVLDLTINDIITDEDGNYHFHVNGKIDIDPRVVPISPESISAIDKWLMRRTVESPYIFTSFAGRGNRPSNKKMTPVAAWLIVKKYSAQCGIDNVKPHDFRRFVATQLAKTNPRHAQKVLGHTTIDSTLKHYVLDDVPLGVTDKLF